MFNIVFSPQAKKDLQKLPRDFQKRVLAKLSFFSQQENPVQFSKPLVNLPPATHRFRIGNYRIAFFISEKIVYVESVGHRREIYR